MKSGQFQQKTEMVFKVNEVIANPRYEVDVTCVLWVRESYPLHVGVMSQY